MVRNSFGVRHHWSAAVFRVDSTLATAPFLRSTDARHPVVETIRPRNSLRLGLCPTTIIVSCLAYLLRSLRKSAKPAPGRRPSSAREHWCGRQDRRSRPPAYPVQPEHGPRTRIARFRFHRVPVFRLFWGWQGVAQRSRAAKSR